MKYRNTGNGIISTFVKLSFLSMSFISQICGGSKKQVTGQVRLQVRSQVRPGQYEEYFSGKEIDYILGVYKNLVLSTELIM